VAKVTADAGNKERAATLVTLAETAAQEITDPNQRSGALASLARAVAEAGEFGWAEALAGTITDPDQRAQSLASLARKAQSKEARSLLASALTAGHWRVSIDILVQNSPATVINIVDEYLSAIAPSGNFNSPILLRGNSLRGLHSRLCLNGTRRAHDRPPRCAGNTNTMP
jgi:hypothetical protein